MAKLGSKVGRPRKTGTAAKRQTAGATARSGKFPTWGSTHSTALGKIQAGLETLQPFMSGRRKGGTGGQGGSQASM